MDRNLIVLADGTGNSAAKPFKTNVWRLYQALDLSDGSQIAVFGDGVGTSAFKPLQVLGLALGVGVKRNVLNLYKFLCLNYNDTDKIWAFGFSRGAFTVRVLAGLIHHEGLVSFRSEEELNRSALAAYRAYRARAFKTTLPWVRWGRALRDLLIVGWNKVTGARTYAEVKVETFERRRHLVNIHFVGVWDTVAAYGLPIDELTQAVDKWVWPMSFRDTSLLTNVKNARHALSLDDERRTFFPIPWNESDERQLRSMDPSIAADRLLQVWFAGVHSNVGGGYPDDGLSHVPLCWMIEEAITKGLRFKPWAVQSYAALATPTGRIYDSRSRFGSFYRYQPRDTQVLMGPENRPLVHRSVITRMAHGNDGYAPLSVPDDIDVLPPYGPPLPFDSAAVAQRRANLPPPPAGLPILPGRDQNYPVQEMTALLDNVDKLSQAEGPNDRGPLVALVLDSVWWRRVLYFVSLALAMMVVAYPLLEQYLRIDGVTDRITGAAGGTVVWVAGLIKGFLPGFTEPWLNALVQNPAAAVLVLIGLAISLGLSTFLQQRIRDRARAAWRVQAETDGIQLNRLRLTGQRRAAAGATVVFGVLLLAGFCLQTDKPLVDVVRQPLMIALAAALVLSGIFFLWRLRHDAGDIDPSKPGFLLALARNLRTSPGAVQTYRFVARTVVPAFFLAICVIVIAAMAHRMVFDGRDAVGRYCESTLKNDSEQKIEKLGRGADFSTSAVCHPTGLVLIEGRQYRITMTMQDDWFDKGIRTDVAGFGTEHMRHALAILLKRWWRENWFQPVARIGERGNYEYVLAPEAPLPLVSTAVCPSTGNGDMSMWESLRDTPTPATPEMKANQVACWEQNSLRPSRTLIVDIKAGATGELFLYVNDAVLLWPFDVEMFYRNNSGTAKVEAARITAGAILPAEDEGRGPSR